MVFHRYRYRRYLLLSYDKYDLPLIDLNALPYFSRDTVPLICHYAVQKLFLVLESVSNLDNESYVRFWFPKHFLFTSNLFFFLLSVGNIRTNWYSEIEIYVETDDFYCNTVPE